MVKPIRLGLTAGALVVAGAVAYFGTGARRAAQAPDESAASVEFVSTQASASITGRVLRNTSSSMPSGARPPAMIVPCPGAAVVLTGPGGSRTAYANGSGYYSISGLAGGAYRIQAFHAGSSSLNGNISVAAGRPHTRNLTIN